MTKLIKGFGIPDEVPQECIDKLVDNLTKIIDAEIMEELKNRL